jgi:transposase
VARLTGIGGLHIRTTRTQLASLCLKEIDAHVPEGLEVHIVMDNYATHKTPKIKAWLTRRPHYHVHFTPTSASWINQVERWRRTSFFYLATVVTPAMVMRLTNIGRNISAHSTTRRAARSMAPRLIR